MKMCAPHWAELRSALETRGLTQFVSKDGKAAIAGLIERNASMPYDPLMSANLVISENALRCGGPYLMQGDLCPLCEYEKNTSLPAKVWIEPCCDAILEDFRQKGWLPKAS
jgi:hypothetical protein